MTRIKNVNHFMTGAFLILVSILAVYASWRLGTFTDVGLGPGFQPRVLAAAQAIIGAFLVVNGFLSVGDAPERWPLRPLIVIVSIIFFAATVEPLGLLAAVFGLVLIACAANNEAKPVETLCLALGSAVGSALLFVTLLGLSIPVFPPFL